MADYRLARWLDQQDPDWPEALINLIDALRTYIRVDMNIGLDLIADGTITPLQYAEGMKDIRRFEGLLAELEGHGPDPTLNGLIKEQTK